MKSLILMITAMLTFNGLFAQEKTSKYEVVKIMTTAECGQCKDRMESKLNYVKGIKFAELNLEDKVLTVKYNKKMISKEEIKKQITQLGYDADEMKADPNAYEKLPACCKIGGMEHERH